MLIIFAGLPGAGKTSIARELSRELRAVFLRVDTVEQAMRQYGFTNSQIGGTGYEVALRCAAENLRLGQTVVIDSVNPWQLTRDGYREVASDAGTNYLDVEVICSEREVHRRRVQLREVDIPGLQPPTWEQVLNRDYHAWDIEPLRIDTANVTIEEAVRLIIRAMG